MPTRFYVITPVHASGSRYLPEAYASLLAQTHADWEWLILENAGGEVPAEISGDARVTVHRLPAHEPCGIGALKRTLSLLADGPTVELDCDDTLAPEALEKLLEAFNAGADFVYSDCAEYRDDELPQEGYPYGAAYGWSTYPVQAAHLQRTVTAMRSPPVTAQNLRLVDWAPNHVRAWTRGAYLRAGGHNEALAVADDHDLMIRFFLSGAKMVHVPECLYFYRVHATNTVGLQNAAIRAATWNNYNRHIWSLAEKFAADSKLQKIDLGGAIDAPPGYRVLDQYGPDPCDLEKRWPVISGSVGVLRAHDVLEHLHDPVHAMNEAYRVLAPGGFFMISVPSTDGKGAFCDPTHVSFWNDLSLRYYTNQFFARYIPKFKGRFQLARCITWFPSQWHKDNNVPYVEAQLIRLGEGYEPMGEVLWPERT